jgi:hypothetical protein
MMHNVALLSPVMLKLSDNCTSVSLLSLCVLIVSVMCHLCDTIVFRQKEGVNRPLSLFYHGYLRNYKIIRMILNQMFDSQMPHPT